MTFIIVRIFVRCVYSDVCYEYKDHDVLKYLVLFDHLMQRDINRI